MKTKTPKRRILKAKDWREIRRLQQELRCMDFPTLRAVIEAKRQEV